jgi:hypothetical protein
VFWIIALAALGYVIRGYLREHPTFVAKLKKIKPVRWLASILHSLALLLKRLRLSVAETVPKIIERLRIRTTKRISPVRRQQGTDHRNRILYHYMHTLDVAKEEGLARRITQTPFEYGKVLEPKLMNSSHIMSRLTEIFVEARYSQHDLNAEQVNQSEGDAKTVQEAIKSLKDSPDGFEIS